MLELILLACAVPVVNLITQGIKKARGIQALFTPQKKAVVRFIAIVISFLAVVAGGIVSGDMIDESIITTFVETVAVFIATQITYYLAKKKEGV